MVGLTESLGAFAGALTFERVPASLVDVARLGLTDHVAARLAAAREAVVSIAREQATPGDVRDMAWLAGIQAHCLEYDDVGLLGHPSAVVASATLAAAEEMGADGRRIVAAYLAGLEVWARLIGTGAAGYHERGWHTTSVIGTLAASAAVANLYALEPSRATMALALASSMAAGTRAGFGTMAKPLQVGHAAQSGVVAARLARSGMTASLRALERRGGLLNALGDPATQGVFDVPRTSEWALVATGLNIRKFPMCYGAERIAEAAIALARQERIRPDAVRAATVLTGRNQVRMLPFGMPRNPDEARFSATFAVAAALVARDVGLEQTTPSFIASDAVVALMAEVAVETHDEVDADDLRFGAFDQVTIELNGGISLTSPKLAHARGHFRRPLSADEQWRKFETCASAAVDGAEARRRFDALQRVEGIPSARDILG